MRLRRIEQGYQENPFLSTLSTEYPLQILQLPISYVLQKTLRTFLCKCFPCGNCCLRTTGKNAVGTALALGNHILSPSSILNVFLWMFYFSHQYSHEKAQRPCLESWKPRNYDLIIIQEKRSWSAAHSSCINSSPIFLSAAIFECTSALIDATILQASSASTPTEMVSLICYGVHVYTSRVSVIVYQES